MFVQRLSLFLGRVWKCESFYTVSQEVNFRGAHISSDVDYLPINLTTALHLI